MVTKAVEKFKQPFEDFDRGWKVIAERQRRESDPIRSLDNFQRNISVIPLLALGSTFIGAPAGTVVGGIVELAVNFAAQQKLPEPIDLAIILPFTIAGTIGGLRETMKLTDQGRIGRRLRLREQKQVIKPS